MLAACLCSGRTRPWVQAGRFQGAVRRCVNPHVLGPRVFSGLQKIVVKLGPSPDQSPQIAVLAETNAELGAADSPNEKRGAESGERWAKPTFHTE